MHARATPHASFALSKAPRVVRAIESRVRLTALGLVMALLLGYRVNAANYSEPALKAVYLHRFSAYVEWPPIADPPAYFLIGVVAPGPVVEEMRRATTALTVDSRRVVIRGVQDAADLDEVQILYIAPGYLLMTKTLISNLRFPTLVVTDEPTGLASGGVINFVRVGANIRFEASVAAAQARGLRLRAGLLSIAVRVIDAPVSDCCIPPKAPVAMDEPFRVATSARPRRALGARARQPLQS